MSNVDVNAPACASEAGSFCQWFWENTGLRFVARNADGALDALVHITLIVLISFGVRALVFRAVNRLTKLTAVGATPAILRPLRAQARRALNRAVSAERRQQRALAVGSLLKSVTSFLIFGTAVILILAELGINVAPLPASPASPASPSRSARRTSSRISWPASS